jgi:hypothetical protein
LHNGSDLALLNEASKAIEFMQKKQVMVSNKRDSRKAGPSNKRSSDKTGRTSSDKRPYTSGTPDE